MVFPKKPLSYHIRICFCCRCPRDPCRKSEPVRICRRTRRFDICQQYSQDTSGFQCSDCRCNCSRWNIRGMTCRCCRPVGRIRRCFRRRGGSTSNRKSNTFRGTCSSAWKGWRFSSEGTWSRGLCRRGWVLHLRFWRSKRSENAF